MAVLLGSLNLSHARLPPPEPDFTLEDISKYSPRFTQQVSPRDYLLQVPAIYFSRATCSYCRTQFGHLDSLQKELRDSNPELNIEILGINHFDANSDFSNTQNTVGRELPWLQDTTDDRVWDVWDVEWRDVYILDPQNRRYAVMNLTQNDLGIPANRQALKTLLIEAAQATDTDNDGLPDAWEIQLLSTLTSNGNADSDADGFDNATEFAFGTHPNDALEFPVLAQAFDPVSDEAKLLKVTLRRWSGSHFNFVVEASSDFKSWSSDGAEINILGKPRNLYDGRGTLEETYILSQDTVTAPFKFVRVRAFPTPP